MKEHKIGVEGYVDLDKDAVWQKVTGLVEGETSLFSKCTRAIMRLLTIRFPDMDVIKMNREVFYMLVGSPYDGVAREIEAVYIAKEPGASAGIYCVVVTYDLDKEDGDLVTVRLDPIEEPSAETGVEKDGFLMWPLYPPISTEISTGKAVSSLFSKIGEFNNRYTDNREALKDAQSILTRVPIAR